MTKLTIGIGEDFPVEEKAGDGREAECCLRRRHDRHQRWHQWMRECFARSENKKKDGER